MLNKPHPFIFNIQSILIPGIVTILVITVLAPFNYDELPFIHRLGWGFAFGIISSTCVVCVVSMFKKLFPNFMNPDGWTVGKEIALILSVLSVISLVIFTLFLIKTVPEVSIQSLFLNVVIYTCGIAIFPVVFLVLFEQYYYQRKRLKEAESLAEQLASKIGADQHRKDLLQVEHPLQLRAENGAIALQIAASQIRYLKSEGNYVDIFYKTDQVIERCIIRNRLKSLTEVLPSNTFFQVHKSHVVNLSSVITLRGNARNLILKLEGITNDIPVSRLKIDELRAHLAALPNRLPFRT